MREQINLTITKRMLMYHGYKYNKYLNNNNDGEWYSIHFPVIKYKGIPTLEAEISIDLETNLCITDVYVVSTRELYSPFYNNEYGTYDTLNKINKELNKKKAWLYETKNSYLVSKSI